VVDEDEEIQRAAEHKTAALHHPGWETAAGATIWACTVQDELVRHESARQNWATNPDRETWERMQGSALLIAVAIDQVLAFESRVNRRW
jgi:hypothetical protein